MGNRLGLVSVYSGTPPWQELLDSKWEIGEVTTSWFLEVETCTQGERHEAATRELLNRRKGQPGLGSRRPRGLIVPGSCCPTRGAVPGAPLVLPHVCAPTPCSMLWLQGDP